MNSMRSENTKKIISVIILSLLSQPLTGAFAEEAALAANKQQVAKQALPQGVPQDQQPMIQGARDRDMAFMRVDAQMNAPAVQRVQARDGADKGMIQALTPQDIAELQGALGVTATGKITKRNSDGSVVTTYYNNQTLVGSKNVLKTNDSEVITWKNAAGVPSQKTEINTWTYAGINYKEETLSKYAAGKLQETTASHYTQYGASSPRLDWTSKRVYNQAGKETYHRFESFAPSQYSQDDKYEYHANGNLSRHESTYEGKDASGRSITRIVFTSERDTSGQQVSSRTQTFEFTTGNQPRVTSEKTYFSDGKLKSESTYVYQGSGVNADYRKETTTYDEATGRWISNEIEVKSGLVVTIDRLSNARVSRIVNTYVLVNGSEVLSRSQTFEFTTGNQPRVTSEKTYFSDGKLKSESAYVYVGAGVNADYRKDTMTYDQATGRPMAQEIEVKTGLVVTIDRLSNARVSRIVNTYVLVNGSEVLSRSQTFEFTTGNQPRVMSEKTYFSDGKLKSESTYVYVGAGVNADYRKETTTYDEATGRWISNEIEVKSGLVVTIDRLSNARVSRIVNTYVLVNGSEVLSRSQTFEFTTGNQPRVMSEKTYFGDGKLKSESTYVYQGSGVNADYRKDTNGYDETTGRQNKQEIEVKTGLVVTIDRLLVWPTSVSRIVNTYVVLNGNEVLSQVQNFEFTTGNLPRITSEKMYFGDGKIKSESTYTYQGSGVNADYRKDTMTYDQAGRPIAQEIEVKTGLVVRIERLSNAQVSGIINTYVILNGQEVLSRMQTFYYATGHQTRITSEKTYFSDGKIKSEATYTYQADDGVNADYRKDTMTYDQAGRPIAQEIEVKTGLVVRIERLSNAQVSGIINTYVILNGQEVLSRMQTFYYATGHQTRITSEKTYFSDGKIKSEATYTYQADDGVNADYRKETTTYDEVTGRWTAHEIEVKTGLVVTIERLLSNSYVSRIVNTYVVLNGQEVLSRMQTFDYTTGNLPRITSEIDYYSDGTTKRSQKTYNYNPDGTFTVTTINYDQSGNPLL